MLVDFGDWVGESPQEKKEKGGFVFPPLVASD